MTTQGLPSGVPHTAFTCRYNSRSLRLISEVEIFPASATPNQSPPGRKYQALYDTGATHSSISPKVVADLQLDSIGAINLGVGGGTLPTTAHLVNLALPNKVLFQMWRVSKVALHGGIDVLIGMDILGIGDFTVTTTTAKRRSLFAIRLAGRLTLWLRLRTAERLCQSNQTRLEEIVHVHAVVERSTKNAAGFDRQDQGPRFTALFTRLRRGSFSCHHRGVVQQPVDFGIFR
jgi:hypothetical protein